MVTVGDLFKEEPRQWGLRGDPYMWRELQERFSSTALPESDVELEELIRNAFFAIIDAEAEGRHPGGLSHDERVYWIRRFAHGGMSSGGISSDFWECRAIPMLLERFNQHRNSQNEAIND